MLLNYKKGFAFALATDEVLNELTQKKINRFNNLIIIKWFDKVNLYP